MSAASAARLERLERRALPAGLVLLALAAVASLHAAPQFFRSYLVAYTLWLGVALGSLGMLMIHALVGGGWGALVHRPLAAASRTLPALVVMALPFLLGLGSLYPWLAPGAAADPIVAHQAAYLNLPFFVVRAVIYFAAWVFFARIFAAPQESETADARRAAWGGPGLVVYGLTMTFAGYDWLMSLEPRWWSSIFGLSLLVGQLLSALAMSLAALAWLGDAEPANRPRLNDLGNLLLTAVMLWAYLGFSQFLIVWAGNLPREVAWYVPRVRTSWGLIAIALILFHFFVPFFLLLSRAAKRNLAVLGALGGALLVLRGLNLVWTVEPSFARSGVRIPWTDVLAPVGLGALWLVVYARELRKLPPEPAIEAHEVGHG